MYEERCKVLAEAFHRLEEQNLEAQVEWDSKYSELIVPLRECRGELGFEIKIHLDELRKGQHPSYICGQKEAEVLHYFHDTPQNSFTNKIESAIANYEKSLRPHIGN